MIATAPQTAPEVRAARAEDRDSVTATVAAAFATDPAWRFLLAERYPQLAREFAGALFDQRVGRGSVWITSDATSVAMWDGPARRHDAAAARQIWMRFNTLADDATKQRLGAYNDAIKRASPQPPFWYLGVLATHPAHQRRGLARAVLEPALGKASADRIECCLETSTQQNRRFYEHRGFQVGGDITIPGAPRTWWMRRLVER